MSTRNRLLDTATELVPDQEMPEPLVFAVWDEEQENVGDRSLSEIGDLLQSGLALSRVVGHEEWSIEWKDGQCCFEVWDLGETRTSTQAYDSLDTLLQSEGSRPAFDLRAFELIG